MPHRQPSLLTSAALAALFLAAGTTPAFPAESPARAWVLDAGARTLVQVALPQGERIATLHLEGAPEILIQSPDGRRLIVLDRGPGKDKGDRGYEARGRSMATILDAATGTLVVRVELGWGLDGQNWFFSEDGRRLTVLCPGYRHDSPEKALPREVITINSASGAEISRATVEFGATPIGTAGPALALIRGELRGSGPDYGRGRLSIVDLSAPRPNGSLDTGGWFDLDMERAHAYLLHRGWPNKNRRLHRNGSVHVYAVDPPRLAGTLDAGGNPRGLYRDTEGAQILIASDASGEHGDEAAGSLRVVRGATLVATVEVASGPRLVVREGEMIFVVGESAVTLIDPVTLQVASTIPLQDSDGPLVDDDDVPTELDLSPDGSRAFIYYGLHNRLVVLDLAKKVAVGSAETGPRNQALLAGLTYGLQAGGLLPGWPAGLLGATGTGVGLWRSHVNARRLTPTMLAVGPGGGFAYAVNSQGRDVAVVNAVTAAREAHIGVRGHELRHLGAGTVLAVLSPSEIHLLDTASNTKIDEIEIPGLRAFETTPDGAHTLALGQGVLVCLSGATGEVRARLTDFEDLRGVVFGRSDN